MDEFKATLVKISDGLSAQNLEAMKFLCSDYLGKKKLESIRSGLQLFQHLQEMNKLGGEDTELLRFLLSRVAREDLLALLGAPLGAPPGVPLGAEAPLPAAEQVKVNIATEVIVDNMGREWRRYGRKLGVTDVQLDGVREKHPYSLHDQVVEMLRLWRRGQGAEARAAQLVQALRECNFNLTADLVEKEVTKRAGW